MATQKVWEKFGKHSQVSQDSKDKWDSTDRDSGMDVEIPNQGLG